MSADNTDDKSSQTPDLKEITSSLKTMGDTIQSIVAEQRASQEATLQALKQLTPKPRQDDENLNLYDPNVLIRKTNDTINQTVNAAIQEERQKNVVMASLGQEYPEMHSDIKLRQTILEEQKKLPLEMQGSAIGYETAVLRAMAREGVMPKSKRPQAEEDFSVQSGRGTDGGSRKSKKVANETLAAAELMGVNISDPKVVERLQGYSQRNFKKYE